MQIISTSTPSLPNHPTYIYKLYRPKVSGGILSVAHAGVGFEDVSGNIAVLHRTPDNGTHISSYKDFSANQTVTKTLIKSSPDENIVKRAKYLLSNKREYAALTNNCEHLVSFVLCGRVNSEQVRNSLLAAGLSYGLLHFSEKTTTTKLLISSAIGLGALLLTKRSKLS